MSLNLSMESSSVLCEVMPSLQGQGERSTMHSTVVVGWINSQALRKWWQRNYSKDRKKILEQENILPTYYSVEGSIKRKYLYGQKTKYKSILRRITDWCHSKALDRTKRIYKRETRKFCGKSKCEWKISRGVENFPTWPTWGNNWVKERERSPGPQQSRRLHTWRGRAIGPLGGCDSARHLGKTCTLREMWVEQSPPECILWAATEGAAVLCAGNCPISERQAQGKLSSPSHHQFTGLPDCISLHRGRMETQSQKSSRVTENKRNYVLYFIPSYVFMLSHFYASKTRYSSMYVSLYTQGEGLPIK